VNGRIFIPLGSSTVSGSLSALHANNASIVLGGGIDQSGRASASTMTISSGSTLMASVVFRGSRNAPATLVVGAGSTIAGRMSGNGTVQLASDLIIPRGHKFIISDNVVALWIQSRASITIQDDATLELWNATTIFLSPDLITCGRNSSIILRDRASISLNTNSRDIGATSGCRFLSYSTQDIVIPVLDSV
jgi:hypothetical protein